jgi:spore germination protein YaaH
MKTVIRLIMIGCVLLLSANGEAQQPSSIHYLQSIEFGGSPKQFREMQWDSLNLYHPLKATRTKSSCLLKKVVFGWYPYWNGTAYTEFDFSLLSDVAYFSYEVDAATGNYKSIYNWKTTPLIDLARAAGTRVSLAVTLFAGHKTFLENSVSRQTLIDSLVSLVKLRNAQGVNIDFEAVPSSQRNNLASFMKDLGTRFHADIPGSVVSIALPSVDWNKSFDVVSMLPYVDLFLIMGYDYYYSGSSRAGPVAPKNNGTVWTPYDATRSVRYYLQTGIPNNQLCLGVPYYGYEWATADSLVNSSTTGKGSTRLYKDAVSMASGAGRLWDRNASVPYYQYHNGSAWYQCWYDDAYSLGYKYDLVNTYNIAGIGIWALGYDRSKQDLWNMLREKFTSCGNTSCMGSFTDMGGPEGNYFTNDNYTFTLTQPAAAKISVAFTNFALNSTDTLVAYNGTTAQDPVIGKYTGTVTPGIIHSSSGAITFGFTSHQSVQTGWQAYWSCQSFLPADNFMLWGDTVRERKPAGSYIGRLATNDIPSITSYSLYGNEYPDNTYFRISADSVFSAKTFIYNTRNSYEISVLGQDLQQNIVLKNFKIRVTPQHIIPPADTIPSADTTRTEIWLFPNPASSYVQIQFPKKLGQILQVDIYSSHGAKRMTIPTCLDIQNQWVATIEVSALPEGIYFVVYQIKNKIYGKKFLIVR